MQRIKNVTSAENLLQLLRSGRESQDPILPDPGACTLETTLTQARDLPLTEATLAALNNNEARMLDAALSLLEQPISHLLMPTVPMPQSVPLPGELLQREIPLASLQAGKLLSPGFAPVSDWDRAQGPGNNNSGGDEQTGSEDTHQDTLKGTGSGRTGVQIAGTTTRRNTEIRQTQQQQTGAGRPQRQTAKRALEVLGSTHPSVADDDEEEGDEEEDNKDGVSDTEGVSDDGLGSHGKRIRSSSGAQSLRTSSYATDSFGGGGVAGKGNRKQTGRPLQRKSYDALVDPTLPPEEIRRVRRILSNRESARRSRKRKATQMSALEDELMEVRMAATELENELIEALTTARALEMDRSQLMAEVDVLSRKLVAYEGKTHPSLPSKKNAVNATGNTTTTTVAPILPTASTVPVGVLNTTSSAFAPPQQHKLSLPYLPAPIKIPIKNSASAPPVVSLPPADSRPVLANTTAVASPAELQQAGVNSIANIRRTSPPVNPCVTGTGSRSTPHFQSPLKQGGSRVSHRVRFQPLVPPTFFPDSMNGEQYQYEDVDHVGLLL